MNKTNIEQTIGYTFRNKGLLRQALTRKSYSEEHGGENNEVLEFIGDKALDFAVVRILTERFGKIREYEYSGAVPREKHAFLHSEYRENKLTVIKKNMVEKKALSQAMDSLGFHRFLIMGQGDINQSRQNDVSVKEDLFEAIVGAVAVDSSWDFNAITSVVLKMIDLETYLKFENDLSSRIDYVSATQEWFQNHTGALPQYNYQSINDCEKSCESYRCRLLFETHPFDGYGKSLAEARKRCAKSFYTWLDDNGYLLPPVLEALGTPDENEPIRQLHELSQKKLVSLPAYDFSQVADETDRILWRCVCSVEENENVFIGLASTKKEAQKKAAYAFLLSLYEKYAK